MATYYVRPNGNNLNAGTGYLASQAWATLTKACQTATQYDTVIIAPNVYRESMPVTNDRVTYKGDPHCTYFIDMTKGDVIVTGENAGVRLLARDNALTGVARYYLNFYDITFKHFKGTFTLNVLTNAIFIRCKLLAFNDISMSTYTNMTFEDSFVEGADNASYASFNFKRCILKIPRQISSMSTYNLKHCICDGSGYATTSYGVYLYGSILESFNNGQQSGYPFIKKGGGVLKIRGSIIKSKTLSVIAFSDPIDSDGIYGSHFKNISVFQYNACPKIDYCSSEDTFGMQNSDGFLNNRASQIFKNFDIRKSSFGTISNCTFQNCNLTAITNEGTSNVFTACTSNELLETQYGHTLTTTHKLSGNKSLKLKGYDYTPVKVIWIPCEANKAKTVKMKIFKNKLNYYQENGTEIVFGNQLVKPIKGGGILAVGNWVEEEDGSYFNYFKISTQTQNDTYEINFQGTAFTLIAKKDSNCGKIGVSIDGGTETIVDLYASTRTYEAEVFNVTGLTDTWHEVIIRHTGLKNSSSSDYNVTMSAYKLGSTTYSIAETPFAQSLIAENIQNVEIAYTHYKTEFVPLFICNRVDKSGLDFFVIDDITY